MIKKFRTFNSGLAEVALSTKESTSFKATTNPTSREDFDIKFDICYEQMSKREQDVEMIEALGRKLSIKIKTPYCELVESRMNLIINNMLYDIVYIDDSKETDELYIYLEEVRELARKQ